MKKIVPQNAANTFRSHLWNWGDLSTHVLLFLVSHRLLFCAATCWAFLSTPVKSDLPSIPHSPGHQWCASYTGHRINIVCACLMLAICWRLWRYIFALDFSDIFNITIPIWYFVAAAFVYSRGRGVFFGFFFLPFKGLSLRQFLAEQCCVPGSSNYTPSLEMHQRFCVKLLRVLKVEYLSSQSCIRTKGENRRPLLLNKCILSWLETGCFSLPFNYRYLWPSPLS